MASTKEVKSSFEIVSFDKYQIGRGCAMTDLEKQKETVDMELLGSL